MKKYIFSLKFLYNELAFIRKNLFTESHEHKNVMSIPKAIIIIAVVTITFIFRTTAISGSLLYNRYIHIPSIIMAINADTKPCNTALRKNGIRMKFHDAPTSFIVCMVNVENTYSNELYYLSRRMNYRRRAAIINSTITDFTQFLIYTLHKVFTISYFVKLL